MRSPQVCKNCDAAGHTRRTCPEPERSWQEIIDHDTKLAEEEKQLALRIASLLFGARRHRWGQVLISALKSAQDDAARDERGVLQEGLSAVIRLDAARARGVR